MKYLFGLGLLFSFFSCQKKIESLPPSITGEVVESNNGIFVEPCHSVNFATSYPVQAGKVPPFRFSKTHYPSGRVKTINMLSRAHPIHAAFKPRAWEVIGTFTYNLKRESYFVGTKQLWEYYKTSTGAAAKRSVTKKNMKLKFRFHNGWDGVEEDGFGDKGGVIEVVNELVGPEETVLWFDAFSSDIYIGESSDEPALNWTTVGYGLSIVPQIDKTHPDYYKLYKKISIVYEPGWESTTLANKKRLSYQPTQNWISMEFNLVEVMGWLPNKYLPYVQRKSVAVEFHPYGTSYKAVQSQVYKNHKYDVKNNLLSYTYGDNVLQKTTWLCK